jgi:imidazolonepropionase-like amidohydrolase
VAIRDATLIDGTGHAPQRHCTLIIRGDRIAAIGPSRTTRIPKNARVIEARGKFLIPGLWDMHVHLWDKQNVLPLYIAHGVTGVRDMGSDFTRVSAWRRAIEAGQAIGPHIITAGPAVGGEASVDAKLPVLVVKTPEEARRAYDQLEAMGVDFLNVAASLPRDSYIALAERARHWDMNFAGHFGSGVSPLEAVNARQNSIEHMSGELKLSDDEDRKLFRQSAMFATRQVPTLTMWQRRAGVAVERRMNDPRMREVPPAIRSTWPKPQQEIQRASSADAVATRSQLDLLRKRVRMMKECGVEIVAGTDTGDSWTAPGTTLDDELGLLVDAGLTPMEALRSATALAAKLIGWDEGAGVLKTGYAADLVLLDADPLTNIANVAKVSGVAIRGRYFGPAALKRMRTP